MRAWVIATILGGLFGLAATRAGADLSFTIGGTWDTDTRRSAAAAALQAAVNRYNAFGDFGTANIYVYYSSGIPTAQASYGGSIGFGGTWPAERVTMHEMAHYLGLPSGNWSTLFSTGTWSGPIGSRLVRQFDGEQAAINGDTQHFWPYGLNYDSEGSEINRQRQVAIVYGMRADLGIGSKAEPSSATVVRLTANDPLGTSGFNEQDRWSDTHFVHPGAAYSTGDFAIRTPASGNSFRFYGDSLTVNNKNDPAGGLFFKGTGTAATTTIPALVLDGGSIHHYSTTADVFRLAGQLTIASDSMIRAKQGTIEIASRVTGSGDLSVPATDSPTEDARYVRLLSPDNAYTGDIAVAGRFELAAGANHRFVLGSGTANSISGPTAGRVRLNGVIQLVTTATSGTGWALVTAANAVYGDTFTVEGFVADAGRWLDGRGNAFVESTGRLGPVAAPTTASWTGTSPAWSAAGNWGGVLPTSGMRLAFGAAGPAGTNLTNDLLRPATSAVAGIEFTPAAPAYTFSPGAAGTNGFTLTAGIVNRSANPQTIHDAIALASPRTAFATSAGGGDLLLTGRVSGTGGIAKSGPGLLTLAGTSTYAGATRIDGGGVRVTGSLGTTGSLVIAGGSFTLARQTAGVQAVAGLRLAAGEAVVGNVVASSTLALGAISRFVGSVARFENLAGPIVTTSTTTANGIMGPWAFTGSGSNTRYATVVGGTITAYEGSTVVSGSGAFGGIPSGDTSSVNYAIAPTATFAPMGIDRSIHTLTYRGPAGTQVSNNGTATLTLNGLLQIGSGRFTIGGSPRLDVVIGASRDLVVATMTSDLTLANVVRDHADGPSSLTKAGPGLLQIGSGSYTGITTVTGGTLQVGLGGAGVAFASSQLVNDGVVVFQHTGTLTVAGRLAGHGELRKLGAGGLVLTGGGPLDGLITVSSGSIVLAGSATLGPTADHRGGITIATGAQFFSRSSAPQTIGGTVAGAGRLVIDGGRLALAGVNTFTGTAQVLSGNLVLAHEQALATARVAVAAGGTLMVEASRRVTVNRLDFAAGGRIDVATGGLTVETGLTRDGLLAALVAGRGDGSWNGASGIGSSRLAADQAGGIPRTLGWLDNGDGSLTVAYAAPGDTNLDGGIDILDAANLLAGGRFDSGAAASWAEGDFGLDGLVDILDVADFLAPALYDAGSYAGATPRPPVALVPEPAMAVIGAAGALGAAAALLRRRPRLLTSIALPLSR